MPPDKDYGLKFSAFVAAYLTKNSLTSLGRIDRPTLASLAQTFYEENYPILPAPKLAKAPKKAEPLDDGEWLVSLAATPCYLGIDIHREFEKCRVWTQTNKQPLPTRRRFVNWLNRVERPVSALQKPTNGHTPTSLSPGVDIEPLSEWRGVIGQLYPESNLAEWVRDGKDWLTIDKSVRERVLREL